MFFWGGRGFDFVFFNDFFVMDILDFFFFILFMYFGVFRIFYTKNLNCMKTPFLPQGQQLEEGPYLLVKLNIEPCITCSAGLLFVA